MIDYSIHRYRFVDRVGRLWCGVSGLVVAVVVVMMMVVCIMYCVLGTPYSVHV